MSQRLTEDTAAMQVRGKSRIIGWTANGCPIWSITGAEGEGSGGTGGSGGGSGDTGSQGGTGDGSGSGGNGGTTGSEGQGGSTGKEGGEGQGESGSSGTVTRAEYDALMARMQAADRNKSRVEQELQQYKDKDKSELEKAQDEAKTRTTEVESLKGTVKKQAVQLAFLSAASHITWHDPSDALEFAMKELADLEVSDDGTVDAKLVKAAADKLAKDKPYLVKSNTSQSGSGNGQQGGGSGQQGGGNGSSGAAVGNGGNNDKGGADRERLAAKYPALRR